MTRPIAALALLALSLFTFAASGPERIELPGVPAAVRGPLLERDWDGALSALDELDRERPDRADLWTLLRATTLEGAGRAAEAAESLAAFEERFPDSPWREKARYRRAELARALGRHAEAEAVYEAGALRLRSPERQAELARIVTELAERLSTPADTARPGAPQPDYARAREVYARALELDTGPELRARVLLERARCALALEGWDDAATDLRAALEEAGEDGGQLAQRARAELGRALLGAEKQPEARRVLEDLVADARAALAAGVLPAGPLRARVAEAMLRIADTWPSDASQATVLGVAALERFLAEFPRHPEASRAAFEVAERWMAMGRDEDAVAALEAFLARPRPDTRDPELLEDDARLRRRALFLAGELRARQGRHADAIARYAEYVRRHPDGPDWTAAQQRIVDEEHAIGADLEEAGEHAAARAAFGRFLAEHPLDPRARALMVRIGELYVREAGTLEERQPDRARALLREAVDAWERVASKIPQSDEASRALYAMGDLQETRMGELEAAIASYRRCDFGPRAGDARARLLRMVEPALSIRTERGVRSDEPARIQAELRNVEELTVQLHALDLEAYFRKHLGHQRIEELDLDLIAPDVTLTIPVEDYERYAPLARTIELPVEGPGAWAVSVIGGERRATTLVLRSDVDLIVKGSRRELFVYAQDVRADAPAAGVELLVALPGQDGEEGARLVRALTGEDGVARLVLRGLEDAKQVAVLGVRGEHVASVGLGLSGLGRSSGLSARGLVTTDRPAYRPGQTVGWRAILRGVTDGSYSFEPGAPCQVWIDDPDGRTIREQVLELSAFGTLHGELALDRYAPTGAWTIRCRRGDGPVHAGRFQVAEYQLRPIELTIEPEQFVVLRGERVEATARARFHYGEPLVDAKLRVELPDGRALELATDAAGEARFGFDTRDFAEERPLQLRAALTEEGVSASETVWLALRGFELGLELERELVLAGQPFEATVRASTPGGAPVARALRLSMLRRAEREGGRWAEVLIDERELATDDTGAARVELSIAAGGRHVLRVEGRDRNGNPVSAERMLFVSGEDDPEALRVLLAGPRAEVGETAGFDVLHRAAPGLALLTIEGEEVLSYRIVRLAAGANPMELAVDHEHFPNVTVAVAMMQGRRFLEARAELEVARELLVSVTPARASFAPGEEASLELRTTDQRGRPVAAELSVAVVDEALFDRFPDRTPGLRGYFEEGARRVAATRSASSCSFRYEGVTREIAAAVLDEAQQQQLAEAWDARREEALEALVQLERQADQEAVGETLSRLRYKGPGDTVPGSEAFNDVIGVGGGAGGKYGGRFGGRRNLRAAGGAGTEQMLRSELDDSESAFWAPAVRTDAEGRATVRFELPRRSTRWRVTVRGVGHDTLLGEARAEFAARAELFLEVMAPPLLVEGDAAGVRCRVHDPDGHEGTARLALSSWRPGSAGGWGHEAELTLDGSPTYEHVFPLDEELEGREELVVHLDLTAEVDDRRLSDRVTRTLRVRPWGVERVASASGVLSSSATIEVTAPDDAELDLRELTLFVGPDSARFLTDSALGGGRLPQLEGALPVSGLAGAAGELVGVGAVLELLRESGRADELDHRRLVERAEGLVGRLVSAQRDDGGWSWAGREAPARPEVTALATWALGRARQLGLTVPPITLERAIARLRADQAQVSDEAKAACVHALAVAGAEDFAAANQLYRRRYQLSTAAQAHATLALTEMDREVMARELAELLADRAVDAPGTEGCRWPTMDNDAWNRSPLATAALSLLALQAAGLEAGRVEDGVRGLLAERPWPPGRARGLANAALAFFEARTKPAAERPVVEVSLPDGTTWRLDFRSKPEDRTLRAIVPMSVGRDVPIELELRGTGRPHYTAVLRGFSRAVEPRDGRRLRVLSQGYYAAPPRYRGRALPTGFEVIGEERPRWENVVRRLPLGATAVGRLRFECDPLAGGADDYVLLEIPLPAGTSVLAGSVAGAVQTHEVEGGVLFVRVGPVGRGTHEVRYTLLGQLPGRYRALPPVLRSAYEPDERAQGGPLELDVLPRGAESEDPYRRTPDELLHLGQALYEDGEHTEARELLEQLVQGFERELEPEPLIAASRILYALALERGDARAVVQHFELLRERDPELVVRFDALLATGRAYRELGEHEQAAHVFRATVEETFAGDLRVAGVLEAEGERARAFELGRELWLAYPDLPRVVESQMALAESYLAAAPTAHEDASLRAARLDRAVLMVEGVLALQRFLALHPTDPAAPDAGLALVSAHLELEDHETAAALAGRMAARFPEPTYRDAFLYSRAVAEWTLGRVDEAIALLDGIAAWEEVDELGRRSVSPNRELALYILGQIHHARRDIDAASGYYERVAGEFPDARQALEAFREEELELPETTRAHPGEPALLELTHRNLAAAELLVYPVDLMTLYLRERDLASVAQLDFSGLAPALARTVELDGGRDLRPRTTTVPLELAEPGAYLVIARGEGLFASGLVLVSDLALEVASEPASGTLRVQVLEDATGEFLEGVDVRVVASDSGRIERGRTDRRGLFVVSGLRGRPTVIARAGERRYAFLRGGPALGAPSGGVQMRFANDEQLGQEEYLKNVIELNDDNRNKRVQRRKALIETAPRGIPLGRVR